MPNAESPGMKIGGVPVDFKDVQARQDIETLNSSLTPNAYSQTGLTTNANVSIISGGYIVVGKIVIVNIRISISATIPSYSELVKGLPTPLNLSSTNYIAVATFSGDGAYINSSGNLQNTQQLSSGNNVFSCVYVKA